ncbi:MAG: hypothetical protein K8T89_18660 [Planctomycetes bacterium]|nr:hypothetical protein [Planctomycetota bacterium]
MFRKFLTAATVAAALFTAPSLSSASEPCCRYVKQVCYKTVTEYVVQQETYVKKVVCYDHCGKPYAKEVTCTRDVQVPVQKQVAYVKWVKVCD